MASNYDSVLDRQAAYSVLMHSDSEEQPDRLHVCHLMSTMPRVAAIMFNLDCDLKRCVKS